MKYEMVDECAPIKALAWFMGLWIAWSLVGRLIWNTPQTDTDLLRRMIEAAVVVIVWYCSPRKEVKP